MKFSTKHLLSKTTKRSTLSFGLFLSCLFLIKSSGLAQNKFDSDTNDNKLIDDYVHSIAVSNIITFDAANIKMFWTDNSVASSNDLIHVALINKVSPYLLESNSLKIQLANVNESMDCRIDVISDVSDIGFTVSSSSGKILSKSSNNGEFIKYHLSYTSFHMEDTIDFSFNLRFNSKRYDAIAIKKIILSFSQNKESTFLFSPGVCTIGGNDITGNSFKIIGNSDNSFSVSGKWLTVFSKKKIMVSDNTLNNSVTVKNIGNTPTHVYFGYAPYTKDRKNIHARNNPYKNKNEILKVLSSADNSNIVIVDSYPDWTKGCYLALDAKEDLSDFPNFSLTEGAIIEVKKRDDNSAEITLDKPVKKGIRTGTPVRVQSPHGLTYIYTNDKILQPGETVDFSSSSIKLDKDLLEYSQKAFCKGTYYVTPIILTIPMDQNGTNNLNLENTIEISNLFVSY